MKKYIPIFLLFVIIACQSDKKEQINVENNSLNDTISNLNNEISPALKVHSNDIFRNVTFKSLGNDRYQIKGQARIFEATINWAVEDGHNILAEGYTTADMGAPEWGNFDFEISVKKVDENTNLILNLFEISAKDGSHVHVLPIALQ